MTDVRFEFYAENGLSREAWSFWFDRGVLVLDHYSVQTRPSKRHSVWKTERVYSRLSVGRNTTLGAVRLEEGDVPLTEEIKRTALMRFTDSIKVKVWSEVAR